MKTLLTIPLLIALLFTGCVTSPTGEKIPDIARIARLSGAAAELGTRAWLSSHPKDASYFAVASESLKGLIGAQNYDPAAFATALQNLPINELKGDGGSLYISIALVVWDEAISEATALNRGELVAATMTAVQKGIEKALPKK